jgi:hypothetical protein
MKRLWKWAGAVLAVGVGAGALRVLPAAASEETPAPLHVASEELQQEVRPQQRQWLHHRRITVDQFANGRLVETVVWRPGKGITAELTLGADGHGRQGAIEWTRVDDHTLIRRVTMASYVQTTEIVRNGETCTARLRYELRPGHAEFEMRRVSNNEPVFISKLQVRRVQCWVGEYSVS